MSLPNPPFVSADAGASLLGQAVAQAIAAYENAHGAFLTDTQIITALSTLFQANL